MERMTYYGYRMLMVDKGVVIPLFSQPITKSYIHPLNIARHFPAFQTCYDLYLSRGLLGYARGVSH